MKTITMSDLRRHAKKVIAEVQEGQTLVLTHRGKPVARLEPMVPFTIGSKDAFYTLEELSQTGKPLGNGEMDRIVYGL
jgi:prevent-host-death family protein